LADNNIGVKDLLPQILAYVSSPFKLFAIIVMATITFGGYFVWQNQAVMLGAYMKSKEMPSMNHAKYDDVARLLIKSTGASTVAIFSVDTILGKRIVERIYVADGSRFKDFDGSDIGLFSKNISNNNDIIRLMANEVPCSEYPKAQSEIGLWYKTQQITYTCRVSVPPDSNQFIGQITIGWKEKPQDLEDILTIAASMLTRK
jgi:hypothetical protein